MARPECVSKQRITGEGPCGIIRASGLLLTDVFHSDRRIQERARRVGSLMVRPSPCAQGRAIIAPIPASFFDPRPARTRFCAPEKDKPKNRSNDGKCDRQGRFWYGTMMNNIAADTSELPITDHSGGLYRIDPDGSVQAFEQGLGVANTFAWSPDDKTMYFADTLDAIYAYDFDAAPGRVANRRTFGKLDTTQYGHPDGSTIDAEGFLWNARWDGGCLVRWAPDGKVDRVVQMPCRRVTSCIFGGPDLNTLYITTVRYGLSAGDLAEQPLRGGIFALDAGVKGIPDGQFAG